MLHFLSGTDIFLVKEVLSEMMRQKKTECGILADAPVYTVRPGEDDPERLFRYLDTVSMFEPKKLALLDDAFHFLKEFRDALLGYLKMRETSKDPAVELFVTSYGGSKTGDTLLAFLSKKPVDVTILSDVAESREFAQAIHKRTKTLGIQLEPAAERLLRLAHTDSPGEILQELEKMALYLGASPENPKTVAVADVKQLGWERVEEDAWQLAGAIAKRDKATMLKILLRVFEMREDPVKLLGLIVYIFRAMLAVKDASERGVRPEDIPKLTKLSLWQTRQYLNTASAFSLEELKKLYERLLGVDFRMKTGEGRPRALLEKFLLSV